MVVKLTDPARPATAGAAPATALDPQARFLAAVPARLRVRVAAALTNPRIGGRGLRAWLAKIARSESPCPVAMPAALVEVYLADPDAEPLDDCADCGLAVPVRVGRRAGHEVVGERPYFPACPCCGGRTGPHAYCARVVAEQCCG